MAAKMKEEARQKAEWRTRLVVDIVSRKFDDEILVAMLEAGLNQAYSEGLLDAAYICERVGAGKISPAAIRMAKVLGRSIRELDNENKNRRD